MTARAENRPLSHVVIITDSLDIDGGSGRVAITSARGLAARGIDTVVFAASGTAVSDMPNLRYISTNQGKILDDSNLLAAASRGLYNSSARGILSNLLQSYDSKNTVVHVHGWTKALSASIFDSILNAGLPLVVTLHEYFMACPTGSLYLHHDREICHLRPMSSACMLKDCDSRTYPHKAYRIIRQLVQRDFVRIPARLRNLVTVSNFSRKILLDILPGTEEIDVIENPIDVIQGQRTRADLNKGYVYVGRLSAEKGPALLAAAARKAGVEVTFVGDGDERNRIKSVNPSATLCGWLEPEAVVEQLRNARAIVMPSLWYETFGLVVLEGAALGIPSIVPSETAPGDLVIDGVTGTHFKRGDIESLADALRAHESTAMTSTMSRNAYEAYWANPASIERHVDTLLQLYDKIRRNS